MISSCKKDNDEPSIRNEFTIDGDTRVFTLGYIKPKGENGNGQFEFEVTLASGGITANEQNGLFMGTGSIVYLELYTHSSSGLDAGQYTFSDTQAAFSMDTGIVAIDYNVDTHSGGEFVYITDGTVDIEAAGEDTIFQFDLTLPDGRIVSGSFRGVLRPI